MATKFLRKIILEELQKVLKEEGLGYRSLPSSGGEMKGPEEIEGYFKQQVDYPESFIQKSGKGIKCRNAIDLQAALVRKFSGTTRSKEITARLSDGKIGPTTTKLINVATRSNFPLNMSGYQQICNLGPDVISDMVRKIDNLKKGTANLAAGKEALSKGVLPSARFSDLEGSSEEP